MEETIKALERAGWRLQNLSHVGAGEKWSCILQRRKPGKDGHAVYGASPLSATPGEALDAAWAAAQGKPPPVERLPQVDRLKIALVAAITALTTAAGDAA